MNNLNILLNKNKYFFKYFFSYLVIIITILIIGYLTIYSYLYKYVSMQNEAFSESILSNISNTIDGYFRQIDKTAYKISTDTVFNFNVQKYNTNDSIRYVSDLGKYMSSNNLYFDMCILSPKNDKVYASSGEYVKNDFYNIIYGGENLPNPQKIDNLLIQVKKPALMSPSEMSLTEECSVYTYIIPFSFYSKGKSDMLIFFIKERDIKKIISDAIENIKAYAYVKASPNQLISDYGDSKVEEILNLHKQKIMSTNEDIMYIGDGKDRCLTITKKSSYNSLTYSIVIPIIQFQENFKDISNVFVLLTGIVLFIGLLLSIIFSLTNYRPLRFLFKHISSIYDEEKNVNCFEQVVEAVTDMVNQKDNILIKLKNQKKIIIDNICDILLDCSSKNFDEVMATLKEYNYEFNGRYFLVLLISFSDQMRVDDIAKDNLLEEIKNSISQNIKDDSSNVLECFVTNKDKYIMCIMNLENNNIEKCINELFTQLDRDSQMKGRFKIYSGNSYEGVQLIKQSFAEARIALEYSFIANTQNIIRYMDIINCSKYDLLFVNQLEEKVIKGVYEQNIDIVEDSLNELIKYIKASRLKVEMSKIIIINIYVKILRTFIEISPQLKKYYSEVDMSTFNNIEEIKSLIISTCSKIFKKLQENKREEYSEIINNINEFIQQNYINSNLTLEYICSEFNMNVVSFSKIFKDNFGDTVMHYISNLRMKRAKDLLETTNIEIKDIITMCGFFDQSNFLRKFKQAEGLTPVKYRSIYKK